MKTILCFGLFLIIFVTCPFLEGRTQNSVTVNDEETILSDPRLPRQADESRLLKFVAKLSDGEMKGRLTGSSSGKMCENYIEKTLRALNLDVRVQEVTFPLYEVQPTTAFELLDKDSKIAASFNYVDDYREIAFSGSGNVKGQLVFAGYGIVESTLDSYKNLDVKGKIVIMLWGKPKEIDKEHARLDKKLHSAAVHGARAVILVPTGNLAKHFEGRFVEARVSATDLKRNIHPDLLHEDVPAIVINKKVTQCLMGKTPEELMADPTPRVLEKYAHLELNGRIYKETTSKNIFGILHGSDPQLSKEVILIGAHYDHLGVGADCRIFYGAADNASGTGVVLEAAHVFSKVGIKPKRTVVFALWCAEEQGLYGSTHYVEKDPLFPLENTKLMIQIDNLASESGPFLTNVDNKKLVQRFAGPAIKAKRLTAVDFGGRCASDDCPFLARGVAAYRFVASGPHHHQTSDTFDSLNTKMVKNVADIVVEGISFSAYQ